MKLVANEPLRVCIVIGSQPEALKLATIIQALRNKVQLFDYNVCATGQHREMLDQALSFMKITPDFNLEIMSSKQELGDVTTRIMSSLKSILIENKPDLMIVQGDTATTFAATLCSYHLQIPVAHVEAGLRTGNNYSPWPEEGYRRLVSVLARFHFAPTADARLNLLREGIDPKHIFVTGNTVIDSLLAIKERFQKEKSLSMAKEKQFSRLDSGKRLILVTSHRREHFGDGILGICRALYRIAERHADVELIYPVHLNPRVQEPVHNILGRGKKSVINRIHLIEPVDYISFVYLMMRAHIILTDSGGVQEESPSLGKPTLILRDATERPEAVEAGCALLVGTDEEVILKETSRLLTDHPHYLSMSKAKNPFGDGMAGKRIIGILAKGAWV